MSEKKLSYKQSELISNTEKLRELRKRLPDFATTFFRGIEDRTSSRTRIAYAYDLYNFFQFIIKSKDLVDYEVKDLTLDIIDGINTLDIEDYMEYLNFYQLEESGIHTNDKRAKARKLSSIKSLYRYLCKNKLVNHNPAAVIDSPKLPEKKITYLDPNEIETLLNYMESLEHHLSGQALLFYRKTKYRDLAIVTLLLGTGLRVSECVSLDMDDINFEKSQIKVVRKGGDESYIYFGDEVADALLLYFEQERDFVEPLKGHEDAVFYSLRRKRISVDAIEDLVGKYSKCCIALKNITPHKLRSTYATTLYNATDDIFLVAECLGHKDPKTTARFYSHLDDERKKKAAKKVTLRKDN